MHAQSSMSEIWQIHPQPVIINTHKHNLPTKETMNFETITLVSNKALKAIHTHMSEITLEDKKPIHYFNNYRA